MKPVGLGYSDWQPDDVEEKVKHDHGGRNSEDMSILAWFEIIHSNRDEEDNLRHNPLHGSEFDVVGICREGQIENRNLREEKVRSALTLGGDKCCPCRGTPPSHNKAEKTAPAATTGLRGPAIANLATVGAQQRGPYK